MLLRTPASARGQMSPRPGAAHHRRDDVHAKGREHGECGRAVAGVGRQSISSPALGIFNARAVVRAPSPIQPIS